MSESERRRAWLVALAAGIVLATGLPAQSPPLGDAEIEHCLRSGRVVEKRPIPVGVTKPKRVELECGGQRQAAAFKTVDEDQKGLTRFERGAPELNFTDSYRYELAAYLLDRRLGLHMVPVAVLRTLGRQEGALVAWVEDAAHEPSLERRPDVEALLRLNQQKAIMRLFDALILNVDRREGNWLVRSEDWSLHLIDHSRAFRVLRQLPDELLDRPSRLPRALYERLRALDEAALTEMMDGLITRAQVQAILARRDMILEKIERDLAQYGEVGVFGG